MSHGIRKILSGEVVDVFAYRFVVRTATGTVPADLGPDGARQISVQRGDHVELWGEMKPSELKVTQISLSGGQTIAIGRGPAPREEAESADAAVGR